MPSVIENQIKWSEHQWSLEGHEWSPGGTRAGTALLWWRSIRPRIHRWLPARDVLEIAPGFGRCTSYLIPECDRLVAVDVTQRCVDVCRARFADTHATFWLNDGSSLPMVESESIDFAFSFDSLVHVEASQIQAYLAELARVLRPGGAAFLHHSNLGAYADGAGTIPRYVTKRHWRGASVSARVVREACRNAGLACATQEIINWIGRGKKADRHRLSGSYIPLTDCFSTVVRARSERDDHLTRVYANPRFVDEWRQLIVLTSLYAQSDRSDAPPVGVLPDVSPRDTVASIRRRIANAVEERSSRARETAVGAWYAWREPLVRRLADGICPDCGSSAHRRENHLVCRSCRVEYVPVL